MYRHTSWFDAGKKILIIKPICKNKWVFPGGVVEENESPQTGTLRELKEETGIKAERSDLSFAGISYIPPYEGFPERIAFTFIYNVQDEPELVLQKEEIEKAEWISFEAMPDKIGEKRVFYADLHKKLANNSFPFYSDLTLIP